jgi:hypothetical protein
MAYNTLSYGEVSILPRPLSEDVAAASQALDVIAGLPMLLMHTSCSWG